MGVDFADYDNVGWPGIVVTNLATQRYALYQNNRDGTFNYASNSSGMGSMSQLHSGWSLRFLDYDNDGWKDLLIAQGHDLDTIETDFSPASLPRAHVAGPKYRPRVRGCFPSPATFSMKPGQAGVWPSATSTTMAASML